MLTVTLSTVFVAYGNFFIDLCLLSCYSTIKKANIQKGEINMTNGERVNEVRKSLGLTLEKFGEKLGVTKTTISRIEKGVNNLTDQMAISICREYNVNYDYLMYGEGEMFDDLPQTIVDELCAQYDLNDFDKALVEMYVSLPAGSRERIKEYMKQLVKKVGWDKTE
jgi:transcriptional regulator with XRE-family HTH domain